jgi:hypothetical protein
VARECSREICCKFVLSGSAVAESECRLATASFSSERDQWIRSKCVKIHDPESPVYELTHEYDGKRAQVKIFHMLLEIYKLHP